MKNKKEQPAPPDTELFRQALDGVTPLAPSNRATTQLSPPHSPPLASPVHKPEPAQIQDTLSDHGAGDTLLTEFMRSGISRMTLRKLRRGQWPVQDSLDLHGLNSDAARKLLLEFLRDATQNGLRHVCVIHGKGWHTDGGEGILKIRVRHWLTQCAEVLAFCEAPPNAGGGGAVLVLLKSGN
ncbi:MAG: Smr/MutS family protein [Nitrosomonadales bacterium]|nr:Smr/MutS family protein [Nitrosomonadales bacterium]